MCSTSEQIVPLNRPPGKKDNRSGQAEGNETAEAGPSASASLPKKPPVGTDADSEDSATVNAAPKLDHLDPFHPEKLRLSQDFAGEAGVKKALVTVPIRKPSREWFIRTHPEEDYRLQTTVIELKEDHEIYLVDPSLRDELAAEVTFGPRALFTAITRQSVLFLWPLRLPGPDGRIDEWSRSALEAASMASGRWVRVTANFHLNAYEVFEATGDIPGGGRRKHSGSEALRIARFPGYRPSFGVRHAPGARVSPAQNGRLVNNLWKKVFFQRQAPASHDVALCG